MKKFNKVIKVEVSVDEIAVRVLDTMSDMFPHRELLVESMFATATDHQIGLMFNALNGYLPNINFEIGQMIAPNNLEEYGNWQGPDNARTQELVQEAEIVNIDLYAIKKLQIKYMVPSKEGYDTMTKWVSHVDCQLVEPQAIMLAE